MDLRTLGIVAVFGISILSMPLAARAQQMGEVPRIGFLEAASPGSVRQLHWEACRQRLRELGYVDGQNIGFEMRWAHGKVERLADLASELVRSGVRIIVTSGTPGALAARKVTTTIPIVMAVSGDPVGVGLVASLARPGGNVTGLTTLSAELSKKRLELLREIVPQVSRVAILWDPTNPAFAPVLRETDVVASSLGISLFVHEVRSPEELDARIAAITRERVAGVMVLPIARLGDGSRLINLLAQYRLPAVFVQAASVEAGGLMAYGPDQTDLFRRAAVFVDKILKGAKPGDLPIEQPTKFEFVLNLKTASDLGLSLPQSLLVRADRIIQ